jgi:hypothetical protein
MIGHRTITVVRLYDMSRETGKFLWQSNAESRQDSLTFAVAWG